MKIVQFDRENTLICTACTLILDQNMRCCSVTSDKVQVDRETTWTFMWTVRPCGFCTLDTKPMHIFHATTVKDTSNATQNDVAVEISIPRFSLNYNKSISQVKSITVDKKMCVSYLIHAVSLGWGSYLFERKKSSGCYSEHLRIYT